MTRAIDLILKKKRSVKIDGVDLPLHLPKAKTAIELRNRLLKAADLDENTIEGVEQIAQISLDVAVDAIVAVVKCERTEAMDLFFLSGGDQGELATEARNLCGLNFVQQSAEEAHVSDPPS